MKYIDLYKSFQKPDIDEWVMDALEEYKTEKVKTLPKTLPEDNINYQLNKEQFYVYAYKRWIENINNITRSEFVNLKNKNLVEGDFAILKRYVEDIPSLENSKDITKYLDKQSGFIKKVIDKYNFIDQEKKDVEVITSQKLNRKTNRNMYIEHSLTLKPKKIDIYKFAYLLLKEFEERKIPYNFKIVHELTDFDTLTLYSDTEELPKYIEIVKEICKNNPTLTKRLGKVDSIKATIDGIIGYQAENKDSLKEDIRKKAIEKAITNAKRTWLKENKEEFLRDYIEIETTNILNKMKNVYTKQQSREETEKLYRKLGYTKEDLDGIDMIKPIERTVNKMLTEYIESSQEEQELMQIKKEIKVKNNEKYMISMKDLIQDINKYLPKIIKDNKSAAIKLLINIREYLTKENIDIKRPYAFKNTINIFKNQDKLVMDCNTYYNDLKTTAKQCLVNGPRKQEEQEPIKKYLTYLLNYGQRFPTIKIGVKMEPTPQKVKKLIITNQDYTKNTNS